MPKLTFKDKLPSPDEFQKALAQAMTNTNPVDDLLELGEYMLDCESFDDIKQWIWQRRQDPANN